MSQFCRSPVPYGVGPNRLSSEALTSRWNSPSLLANGLSLFNTDTSYIECDLKKIWTQRLGVGASLVVIVAAALWSLTNKVRSPTSNGSLRRTAGNTNIIMGLKQVDSSRISMNNSGQPFANLNPAPLPAMAAAVVNAPAFLKPAADLFFEQFASLHSVVESTDEYLASPLEKWHQRFLHDTRDSNWSSMAQAQVESSLYVSMSSTIELVSVQCASSVCEIQAASNSAQVSEKAASEWQSTLSKMAGESWWQSYGFDSQNYAQSIASDGRVVFVAYFNRAGPGSNGTD
jgi:hypothetical protein